MSQAKYNSDSDIQYSRQLIGLLLERHPPEVLLRLMSEEATKINGRSPTKISSRELADNMAEGLRQALATFLLLAPISPELTKLTLSMALRQLVELKQLPKVPEAPLDLNLPDKPDHPAPLASGPNLKYGEVHNA